MARATGWVRSSILFHTPNCERRCSMSRSELKGKVALVVEDDTDYAAFLAESLREDGMEAEVALDADQALQRIAQRKPDVITLDIQMPRDSGLLFFRRIRSMERFQEIPVVVVTGLTANDAEMVHFLRTFLERDGLRLFTGMLDVGQPLATPLIARLKGLVGRGGLQILDSPPGTACPVVETIGDADFCLMVTEPTPFGLFDLTMAVEMVRELDVPFAVVVNRDRDDFPDLDAYLEREGIPVLMRIPDSVDIARLYSRGVHFVEGMPEWEERFRDLLVRVIAGGGAS